ncbi:SusC/RagA family TonB-linked outer membrane protein [Hymenobacter sp. BT491]|uniref:SusC/RagA family TonB-linked outer membrane protein n=1 Tax=Hymenobacter sp. BT491 TaxID=2766779 RepID=UPI0016536DD4|nr:SusC/RagA family TonB-linked outer membrane protein [Hymenobacter sp. BT491]MBC6990505.1 SusC/RagA family TonB-linked outer membrane protein [Hymenobacter sp. BT491]
MKKLFLLFNLLLFTALLQQVVAQNRSISGRVTDRASGQGLPGVTVVVKGTTVGASTNSDGTYALSVPASATALTFSSIGYIAVEKTLGDASTYDVALATDSKQLGEVVVTGALGIQRQQQQVGYATASLDSKELTQARVTNVANGLAGKVSGLQIQTLNNGVNPSPRVTLRGSRSLTGNNEALIVLDGVITTNDVLGALNPDDIASIDVLKGANAAALYGSQASNGALIITTKKGKAGTSQVTFSHTSQFESISFLPKFQKEFGPGSPDWYNNSDNAKAGVFFKPDNTPDTGYGYQYQGFENQQYGPRFDGSVRPFGQALANGDVQQLTYEARPDEKRKFFNTGYQMQNGVTFSGGNDKTKFFASYQNLRNNGIVPKDVFDRNAFRFNASHEIGRLTAGFNISYTQQKANVTSNLDRNTSVYWNVFNTSVMAPLTSYKDYQNDKYSDPSFGYYNAYYFNPYFIIDANRTTDRRNTVQGNIDLSYKLTDWLRVQYRLGTTTTAQSNENTQNKFTLAPGSPKQIASYTGFVQDLSSNLTRINSDLFASMDKTFGDFSVQAILGNNVQQLDSRYDYVASTALAVPVTDAAGVFNLQNRIGNLDGRAARAQTRLYAFYGDLTLGYKDFFYLHGSGRNDNISILDAGNRSFFYPAVDASFVVTNAVQSLKDLSFLDYAKIRGGISKVSQVNLSGATVNGVYNTGGAYQTAATYPLALGFPFPSRASFTAAGQLVQPGLKPEDTRSIETGIELSFLQRRIAAAATYYAQRSTNQTVNTTISGASGYQTLLLNAGEVQNQGVELDLNLTPIRLENGLSVTVGGNFNYNNNKVISLPGDLPQLVLAGSGAAGQTTNADLYAIKGKPFPSLVGTYYQRTDDGRVKMAKVSDPNDPTLQRYVPLIATDTKNFGNTQPKYKYGFNANITYKGLTLSGQGELRTGYVVYNTIGENLDFTGGGQRSVQFGRQDFVYPNSAIPQTDAAGNVTYVPNTTALTPGGSEFWANTPTWNTGVAENYVTSGKFFKIREVSLSYALPTAMVSKIGLVKGASVNLFGRNIFTWVPKSNIYTDPEFSNTAIGSNAIGINTVLQTPPTKFYGATLNVTF